MNKTESRWNRNVYPNMNKVINLKEKLAQFTETWSPKIVGEVNDCFVKLVKLKGEFVWHHHEDEDELFLVLKGQLRIEIKDRDDVVLNEGEMFIVPKKVEHRTVAERETHVLLVEPKSTSNTGNVEHDMTVKVLERI